MGEVYEGYEVWLNDILFAHKGDGDVLVWLGDGRWFLTDAESGSGESVVIEIQPAVVAAKDH